jgi:hypothetical protein
MTGGKHLGHPEQSGRGGRAAQTVTITCCKDDHAHEVSDVELAAGGQHALCGHLIAAAPMVAPNGPPCPLCAAIRDARKKSPGRGWLKRHLP